MVKVWWEGKRLQIWMECKSVYECIRICQAVPSINICMFVQFPYLRLKPSIVFIEK